MRTPDDLGDELTSRTWRNAASCIQIGDPEVFFPGKGESNAAAKRVCLACPVRSFCLDDAIENNEGFGIWGGLSNNQRKPIRRARRAAAATAAEVESEGREAA